MTACRRLLASSGSHRLHPSRLRPAAPRRYEPDVQHAHGPPRPVRWRRPRPPCRPRRTPRDRRAGQGEGVFHAAAPRGVWAGGRYRRGDRHARCAPAARRAPPAGGAPTISNASHSRVPCRTRPLRRGVAAAHAGARNRVRACPHWRYSQPAPAPQRARPAAPAGIPEPKPARAPAVGPLTHGTICLRPPGKWEPEAAIQMSWTDGDIWTAEAEVPVG